MFGWIGPVAIGVATAIVVYGFLRMTLFRPKLPEYPPRGKPPAPLPDDDRPTPEPGP